MAPRATIDDHRLDFCLVHQVNKIRLAWLFPRVYFGRHLNVPEVEYFQGERLRLDTDPSLQVFADGEYVCQTPIEVGIEPAALQVVATTSLD